MSDGLLAMEIRRIIREELTSARDVLTDETERRGSSGETWLSLSEAAKRIGVSSRTIRRYVAAGRLRVYAPGARTRRVRAADVDALMRTSSAAAVTDEAANLAALVSQIRSR